MSAKFNRCTVQIRKLPLEAFRLPRDGRKWKQLARSRYGLLLEISTFANGDGSFLSPDTKINFSPSSEKLLRHRSDDTLYRLANDLRELGLLSWHRRNHYGRRFYEIHLSEKQGRYSRENTSDIREENTSDIRDNTSDQQGVITPPSSSTSPSLEAFPSGGSPGSPPLVTRVGHDHHHPCPNTQADKTDDDDGRVNLPRPEQTNPAVPRVQRLKDSAFEKIKIKHGHRFDDAFIRERLDVFESLAPKPVISANYFVTCFENKVESESSSNSEPMPNAASSATHDDLLKDRKNYGLLPWSFGYIVVRTGGSRREILSHNTAQAMTGCSVEHMAEHLRADGFWAEVYQPRKRPDDSDATDAAEKEKPD